MFIRTFHWLALLVLAGCALHQAVYAPVGWNKAAEGTYVLERGDYDWSRYPPDADNAPPDDIAVSRGRADRPGALVTILTEIPERKAALQTLASGTLSGISSLPHARR
jgi:hypothetical protein